MALACISSEALVFSYLTCNLGFLVFFLNHTLLNVKSSRQGEKYVIPAKSKKVKYLENL